MNWTLRGLIGVAIAAAGGGLWLSGQGVSRVTASGDRVLTPANAFSKLVAATPGVYRLAPGRYPPLVLRQSGTDGAVVVESLDPANPAMVGGLLVAGANGATIRNLVVEGGTEMPKNRALVFIRNSSKVEVRNVTVRGPAGGPQIVQYYGLMVRDSSDVRIVGSRFTALRYGLGFLASSRLTIEGSEFSDLQTDGIRGGGVSDLLIQNNVIGRFAPTPRDHPDGIQLWTINETEPARRIVIRDNVITRGSGNKFQGIFIRDNKAQLPFEDLEIRGNLVLGSMYNGIAVLGVTGAMIANNRVHAFPDGKTWIRVSMGRAVRLEDNVANAYVEEGRNEIAKARNRTAGPVKDGGAALLQAWLAERPQMQTGPFLASLAGRRAE